MENTQAVLAPAAGSRQERQLVAGRYRLAAFHRRDESTEVWRALDERVKQVVTLEFLIDREPASKERFLTAARRMESIAQPSVMKVAAIHDGPDATYIVFEHLVHVPVPLDWLKPAEGPAPILTPSVPSTVAGQQRDPAAGTPPGPAPSVAVAPEAPTSDVATAEPAERHLDALVAALRARDLALIDAPLLRESANEILAAFRLAADNFRPEETIAQARELLGRGGLSALTSALAGAGAAVHRALSLRPRARVRAPRPPAPARVRTIRIGKAAEAKPAKLATKRAPRTGAGLRIRVRWGRVVARGLIPGLLAAVVIALPGEVLRNLGTELGAFVEQRLRAVALSTGGLARAGFEVPPLGAYGATFEAQAPYPTAAPGETVEWVVALRNTGSAGWYRGIDGAQASLALADGSTAGVQTTQYVGPGQVGWFVVHFRAPSEPGTHIVAFKPRIDGRGPLPDLGIYATLTVSPKP